MLAPKPLDILPTRSHSTYAGFLRQNIVRSHPFSYLDDEDGSSSPL
jgi:hypothetical protein